MKISKKTIEEIFEQAIIEDVIGEFVNLKKTGANYKGLSPFNDEKTPSFVVSPSKEIWKDFSSGKGGNVISFLMEHEQYSYPEALLFLAKKYNINVEYIEYDSRALEKDNERRAMEIVLNFVQETFSKNLFNSTTKEALDYLCSRGFKEEVIKEFQLGFCSELDNTLALDAREKKYNVTYLHKARIIDKNNKNRFRGRIIFPIYGISGNLVGFGGRILDNNKKTVKYLNSDSSAWYQKSKILYGMHLAKKYIKKLDSCYVVEGYTDVMALSQVGIKNVVSSCGTALTTDQIRLMHRFTKNIIILFDSDRAGVEATIKAIDNALKEGMNPKILQFPKDEDPASFVLQKNKVFVEEYMKEKTLDFIDFKKNLTSSKTIDESISITKSILNSISLINDPIAKTLYLRRASKQLHIPEKDLLKELENKSKKTQFPKPSVSQSLPKSLDLNQLEKRYLEELQLIRLIVTYGSQSYIEVNSSEIPVVDFIIHELEKDNRDINVLFSVPIFNAILNEVSDKRNAQVKIDKDYFLNHTNSDFRLLSAYLIGDKHLLGSWNNKDIVVVQEQDILSKVTKESILRFKLKRIQSLIQELLTGFKNTNDKSEEKINKFTRLSLVEKKIQKQLGRLC